MVITTSWEALYVDLIGPYTLKGKDGTEIDFMCLTMIDPASSWFKVVELPVVEYVTTGKSACDESKDKDAYFDIPDVNHWKPGWEANSLGYRGEPFENYAPILASGCSFTYGQGVRPEGTWPAQLAGMLDLSHHNLGVPGSGVGYQVGNIFSYIYTIYYSVYIQYIPKQHILNCLNKHM